MKKTNRMAALVMATALTLSLAACGGGTTADGKTPGSKAPDKDPVVAATEKLASVKSMDSTMSMAMNMKAGDQSVESLTDLTMTYFSDPLKVKAEMNISAAGTTQTMTVYAEAEGESYTMYVTPDGATWQKGAATMDDIAQYNIKDGMGEYLAMSSGFTAGGDEQVNGADATKYTGIIPGKDMEEVLKSSGALDSLSGASAQLTEEQMKDLFTDVADMPISLWIDKASGYPVKYEMDMTGVMSTMMGKIVTAMGQDAGAMSVDKMVISMTCTNFDKATEFEIPAEAKAAA